MKFKTYSNKNKPVFVYIHGECLSAFSFKEEIKELKKDERKLLYLRYFADKTQTEIGEELGISQVQVSRMEKKILKTMREHAKE